MVQCVQNHYIVADLIENIVDREKLSGVQTDRHHANRHPGMCILDNIPQANFRRVILREIDCLPFFNVLPHIRSFSLQQLRDRTRWVIRILRNHAIGTIDGKKVYIFAKYIVERNVQHILPTLTDQQQIIRESVAYKSLVACVQKILYFRGNGVI